MFFLPNPKRHNFHDIMYYFAHISKFKGILHICHISVPESVKIVGNARKYVDFKITLGLTPHHVLFYDELMNKNNGLILKVNPPLRTFKMCEELLENLFSGKIDWIESDHAPHNLKNKLNYPYSSGIWGMRLYKYFINFLKQKKIDEVLLRKITCDNIVNTFSIKGVS